ncbi:hypothetical protein [Actinoplanes sp. NPDC020271]|uniref:hypothetical protein n=1 Tax=Actinoplanes sp. NPDC020271 TaxID=3363896 RepID=UPI003792987B
MGPSFSGSDPGFVGGGSYDVDGLAAGVQQTRPQQQQESFGIALAVGLDGLAGPVEGGLGVVGHPGGSISSFVLTGRPARASSRASR